MAGRTINWGRSLSAMDTVHIRDYVEDEGKYLIQFSAYQKQEAPILVGPNDNPVFVQVGTELVNEEKRPRWDVSKFMEDIRSILEKRFIDKIVDKSMDYVLPWSAQACLAKMLEKRDEFDQNLIEYLKDIYGKFYRCYDLEFYITKNIKILKRYDGWKLSRMELDIFIDVLRQGKVYRFPPNPKLEAQRDSKLIFDSLKRGVENNINNFRHWYVWSRIIVPAYQKKNG